jgi:hypothetical protein
MASSNNGMLPMPLIGVADAQVENINLNSATYKTEILKAKGSISDFGKREIDGAKLILLRRGPT